MAKLSKEAFAIMAMCEETKKPFGITVNPQNGCYAFTWHSKSIQTRLKGKDMIRPVSEVL
jgi:hypothetical protein